MNYFEHDTSFGILREKIAESGNPRGYKALLAEAAGCQRSFISQVLSGKNRLSAEHAMGLARYWGMTWTEQEYFLDLVNLERAGTDALRQFYRKRVTECRMRVSDLNKRFKVNNLPDREQQLYYGSWINAAIHILLTVPDMCTPAAIATRLSLPLKLVDQTLNNLALLGLAKKEERKWKALETTLHLPKESPLNVLNHNNWRQRAVQNSILPAPQDIHYTSVYSLSRADAKRLTDHVVDLIDHSRRVVSASKEEEVVTLLIDLFRV